VIGLNERQKRAVNSELEAELIRLWNRQVIDDLCLGYYQPEERRYIDQKGLKLFEEISCIDSQIFVTTLEYGIDNRELYALSAFKFWIEIFFPNISDRIAYLEREISRRPIKHILKNFKNDFQVSNIVGDRLHNLMIDISNFFGRLSQQQQQSYIRSILHMTVNRHGLGMKYLDIDFFRYQLQADRALHFKSKKIKN
ncbi:MAG: lantibiotic dehydratase C-terminal domain-containing protein, partial [Pseudobdellovibrionaceae bacterium]